MLDDLGLAPALEWQAREVSRNYGIRVNVAADGVSDDLPEEHKTCIYRIVKEAHMKVAQTGDPRLVATVAPSTALTLLLTQEAQLQAEAATMSAKFGNSYPKLKEIKEQQAKVEAGIVVEDKNIEKRIEEDYRASKKTEDLLRNTFEQQKSKAFELNQNASQFAILKHEVPADAPVAQPDLDHVPAPLQVLAHRQVPAGGPPHDERQRAENRPQHQALHRVATRPFRRDSPSRTPWP